VRRCGFLCILHLCLGKAFLQTARDAGVALFLGGQRERSPRHTTSRVVLFDVASRRAVPVGRLPYPSFGAGVVRTRDFLYD
jgi:hypothetical protein